MKHLSVILALAGVVLLAGCGQKDTTQAEVSGPPSKEPVRSAQTQKALDDPNVPPAVKQMIQEEQKQHGAAQRPVQH